MRLLPRPRVEPAVPAALLFDDAEDPCALLDQFGAVARAGAGLLRLLGVAEIASLAPFLKLPDLARLSTALAAAQELTLETVLATSSGPAPIRLRLLPLPGQTGFALLRLSSLGRVRALEARLEDTRCLTDVGRLAGGIAHDFNNLLTAILGAVEDLLSRAPAGDVADLTQIRDSAGRGAALVRQLLAFGRQQTLQPRVLALNDALSALDPLLRRLLGPGNSLAWALDTPTRHVRMDPAQLDQVIVNLAVNARDAMPQGGTLTIGTSRRLLLDAVEEGGERIPPGRYAEISVRDTGGGIPPEILPRLFTPFFTTKPQGGTGLGLATVQGIVHQSGGYLTVRPGLGQGAEFRILLPHHSAPAAPPPDPPADAPAPACRTLLLVDDEAPVRTLCARALRRAGWTVVEAPAAEDALETMPADLAGVISDVVMPGMDGPALVARLRETHPRLPALLVSGYAGPAQRATLEEADIRFLAKPFTPAELVAAAAALAPA